MGLAHVLIHGSSKFELERRGTHARESEACDMGSQNAREHHENAGEIEALISEGVARFEQDYMGRGPKEIHAHLLGDLLVVRLRGVLTTAEQQLVKTLPAEKGRDLLKQVRTHLMETARPVMEAIIQEATGVKVLSLHHDISTITGEEVVIFTLGESPLFREAKRN
jgi:uncharacterized protein YbcI